MILSSRCLIWLLLEISQGQVEEVPDISVIFQNLHEFH